MKKITICLSNEYYLKYSEYEAFNILKKKYKINFLINKDKFGKNGSKRRFTNIKKLKKENYLEYSFSKKDFRKYLELIFLGLARYQERSNAFRWKMRRTFPSLFDYFKIKYTGYSVRYKKKPTFSFYIKITIEYFYKPFLRWLRINFLSNKVIFFLYKKFIIDKYNSNDQLFNQLKKIKPDLIIYPSHCYEPETFKLVEVAEKINSKTLFLIDNWDNLSTKTVLFKKPNAITVWGDQTKKHAIKIHDISEKKIFKIGNPKFDSYFSLRKKKLKSNFKFKYILFLGVRVEHQELEALKKLDNEISNKVYNNLKILYRPHPGNEFMIEKAKNLNLKNVIFDPNMKKFVESGDVSYLNNKENYFEKLITNSLFLVGCLTTVTIEALIFKKKQIYFSYPEKFNIAGPKQIAELIYFDKIKKISALTECNDLNKLQLIIRKFYKNNEYKKINRNLDQEINYFYEIPKKTYSKKIFSIVKELI